MFDRLTVCLIPLKPEVVSDLIIFVTLLLGYIIVATIFAKIMTSFSVTFFSATITNHQLKYSVKK